MSDKDYTYEKAMERLSEIVARLESGEATLDESMELFEEGAHLSALCYRKLEAAEQRITEFGGANAESGEADE